MLTIAILDDQVEEAMHTKQLLLPYLEKRNLEYERIDIFLHGEGLIKAKKQYDILFLDIEVGAENGIEIAHQLRKENANMIIIVITGYIKYSIEGYKIQAARYLLKPVAPSLLYSELDEVLSEAIKKPTIVLHEQRQERRVYVHDIYYFESYGRKVSFHTRCEVFNSKESVSYWAQQLANEFIECYKGVYVHIRYIASLGVDTLELDNKQVLPLARRRVEAMRCAWIKYQEQQL